MARKTLLDVISPIMAGPSSSHTAGAVRIGLMAREIYGTDIQKVQFRLYNSFATTGKGHGTDKALLAGLLGLEVDSTRIKNIFKENLEIDYSFEYVEDSNKHPNAVRIIINDDMTIRAESVGSGEIRITNINGFNVKLAIISSIRYASNVKVKEINIYNKSIKMLLTYFFIVPCFLLAFR